MLCSCFFGLILQDPLGDEAVEELDEGSEAERTDEGAQTHKTARSQQSRAQKASVKTRQPKYWKCV